MSKIERLIGGRWSLAILTGCLLLCTGCAGDDEVPQPVPAGGDVAEVPITLSFGTGWQRGDVTRVAPPGSGTTVDVDGWDETDADKVRIITFRRKDLDNTLQGGENTAPFTYDPSNDNTVDCVKGNRGENFTARGTLRKTYGYEYRVVAVAYDSRRANGVRSNGLFPDGEAALFDLNLTDTTTFNSFAATVKTGDVWSDLLDDNNHCLNRKMVFVPEFFYGYCTTVEGSEIIKFAETDSNGQYDKSQSLTGILYRGVAKVQVNLTLSEYAESIYHWTLSGGALLATNVNTVTGLSSYDDFLTPSVPVPDYVDDSPLIGYTGSYTVIDYQQAVESAGAQILSFTAFVLPAKMKLGVRFEAMREGLGTHYSAFNGEIHVDDMTYHDGAGATGIVSPDVDGNLFYFRRNHKYVLSGSSASILSHQLD